MLNEVKVSDRANYLNCVLYNGPNVRYSSLKILSQLEFKLLAAKFELRRKRLPKSKDKHSAKAEQGKIRHVQAGRASKGLAAHTQLVVLELSFWWHTPAEPIQGPNINAIVWN